MDVSTELFRPPAAHQSRRGHVVRELRVERLEKPTARPASAAERFVLDAVLAERDRLREHLDNVRELANRMMIRVDEGQDRILQLEAAVREKDALIAALEEENAQLIRRLSARESRISALESFLRMISEADRRT